MVNKASISGQALPTSPQLLLDNYIEESWTQTETSNVKVIIDFVQKLMNDHDFDYVKQEYSSHSYVQHNRGMTDGINGVLHSVKDVVKRYPEYSYDVKRIIASSEFVVFHSHITVKAKHRKNEKKGFIISDTWRIENGKVVEHWDAIQPLNGFFRFYSWMVGGKVRNSNGLF